MPVLFIASGDTRFTSTDQKPSLPVLEKGFIATKTG